MALLSASVFPKLPLKPMFNMLTSLHLSTTTPVQGYPFSYLLGSRVLARIESCLHEDLLHQSLLLPGWDSAKLPVWALCSELWEGLWLPSTHCRLSANFPQRPQWCGQGPGSPGAASQCQLSPCASRGPADLEVTSPCHLR